MFAELVVAWILMMNARTPCETSEQCETYIRPYVEFVFDDHPVTTADAAVQVAWCESRWKPWARNRHSTATGLFQYLYGTWHAEAHYWGWDELSDPSHRLDPVLMTNLTYKVVERDNGWRQWQCKP